MFTMENFVANERTSEGQASQYHALANDFVGNMHSDPGLFRPYRDDKGRVWVDVTVGHEQVKDAHGMPVMNAQGTPKYKAIYEPQLVRDRQNRDLPVINFTNNATVLRKDQWHALDNAVQRASRKRLRLWADMRAANTFGGFDGMSTPFLSFERLTDSGQALMDMDGMSEGHNAAPKFALDGQPLPITHSDFFLSQRFLSTSRARGGPAADTIRGEMAGRRVAEMIETTALGTNVATQFKQDLSAIGGSGTGTIYGLLNHPDIITKTNMTTPDGTNGPTVLSDWLAVRELMYAQNFFGPFTIYHSTDYDQWLDNLFSTSEPSAGTLRERLMKIDGVSSIKRLDYLTSASNPYTLIFASMDENIEAVSGMEITTVQWESMGGMRLNFKVMAIQVPRIKSVYVNTQDGTGVASSASTVAGICKATTS